MIGALDVRPRVPDNEKITINLGFVDLGQIDLLVREGFYANRTDFIRTAIRNQLDRQGEVVHGAARRQSLELGFRHITRAELERARAAGEMVRIRAVGLVVVAADIDAELARASIASVSVLGGFHASPEVRAALADRMQ